MLVRPIFLTATAVALLLARTADADPQTERTLAQLPRGDQTPPKRDTTSRRGIALRTDGWDGEGSSGLRVALQNTLGIAIHEPSRDKGEELATVVVRRRADGTVTIVFTTPDGREVERTLDLPADRALATETIALAAGNLVRDEAAELVASLTPPPAPPPPPPEVPPTADVGAAPPAPANRRISCNDGDKVFFGADFFPGVGTSSVLPSRTRTLSFNFVAGHARGLNGFELGVGANIESTFMCGTQIAAGANVVLGDVRGAQIAIGNVALGEMQGAQIGVANFARGNVRGLQLATVSASGGSLSGAQIGVVNLLAGSALGNQTGVVNLSGSHVDGAQIGVVNVANGNVNGAQVAVTNLANGPVDGAQVGVANIVNGDVTGPQIGVFNYADVSDYPVGVVSIVRHGRTSADAWVTETGTGMAGVRHGGRVLYNVYGVGYRPFDTNTWSLALGLGGRANLAEKLHLDIEAIAYWMQKNTPFQEDAQISSLGANIAYDFSPMFSVFGGPSLNVLVTPHKDMTMLAPSWSTNIHESDSIAIRGWAGAALGIRANL
ncbi:MAG: hypothetical protein ABW133_05355 [Polyangiaceae bacterium]